MRYKYILIIVLAVLCSHASRAQELSTLYASSVVTCTYQNRILDRCTPATTVHQYNNPYEQMMQLSPSLAGSSWASAPLSYRTGKYARCINSLGSAVGGTFSQSSAYTAHAWTGDVSVVGANAPTTAPAMRRASGFPGYNPEPFPTPLGDIPWALMLLLAIAYSGIRWIRTALPVRK